VFWRRKFVPANFPRVHFQLRIAQRLQERGVHVPEFPVEAADDHTERVCFNQAAESLGGFGKFQLVNFALQQTRKTSSYQLEKCLVAGIKGQSRTDAENSHGLGW